MLVMDGWTVAVWVLAGYVAVAALVRLMLARRNAEMEEVQEQIAAARVAPVKKQAQDRAA